MIKITYSLFILLLLLSCSHSAEAPVNEKPDKKGVVDITKFRHYDTTGADSLKAREANHYQAEYDSSMLKYHKELLKELNLKPLSELPPDSNGYRIIVTFGWGNEWSGVPLSMALYESETLAFVESVELNFNNRSWSNDFRTERKQLNYPVAKQDFIELRNAIDKEQLWQAYLSDENKKGWEIFDNSNYFIEMKSGLKYKLITTERGNFGYEMMMKFLKCTHFNDAYYSKCANYLKKHPELQDLQ